MPQGPSFFVLLKRDFWGLFSAIWLLGGLMFLVIGTPLAVRTGEYLFVIVGLLITAVGGTLSRKALQRIRIELHLRREGLTAQGEVLAVEETSFRYNRRVQWKIRYRYVDRMGEEHRGSSGYLEPEEAAEWKAGDVGVVRFDPRRPSRSIWIGRPEEL
jgi:hypothetical protein